MRLYTKSAPASAIRVHSERQSRQFLTSQIYNPDLDEKNQRVTEPWHFEYPVDERIRLRYKPTAGLCRCRADLICMNRGDVRSPARDTGRCAYNAVRDVIAPRAMVSGRRMDGDCCDRAKFNLAFIKSQTSLIAASNESRNAIGIRIMTSFVTQI
jgi:hypothetical protein